MTEQAGGHSRSPNRSHVPADHDPPKSGLDAYYPLIVIATVILVVAGTIIDIWMTR
jgi:hypothetical protein